MATTSPPSTTTTTLPITPISTSSSATPSTTTSGTININITDIDNGTMTTSLPMTITTMMTTLMTASTQTGVASTTTTAMTTTMAGTTAIPDGTFTILGLSTQTTLLVVVFAGCTALILITLFAICCRLACLKTANNNNNTPKEGDTLKEGVARTASSNLYADPYRIMENHYHSNDVTRLYATPELTYAKPEVYSTFINPSFYEDVYARWKLQEQGRFNKVYDSPYQYSGRLREQMKDNPELRWSKSSLRAVDNYDYDKYGRIPRGRVSGDSEHDDADTTVTMEPNPFTTF